MKDLKQKITKVQPIVRARKAQLDTESVTLSQIRIQKAERLDELEATQKAYIECVDELNRQRQLNVNETLQVFEQGLDFVKQKWYEALKSVREAEAREQAQLANVLVAQRNLKAVQVLEEKYDEQYRDAMNKAEQKQLDETAARMKSQKGR